MMPISYSRSLLFWLTISVHSRLRVPTMTVRTQLRTLFACLILFLAVVVALGNDSSDHSPVDFFRKYLRIRTAHPNPDYSSAISLLSAEARAIGLQSKVLEFVPGKPLLLVTWHGRDPSLPSLLLNSHLDSVPAEPQHWVHPPFAAHKDETGRIFARGAQDDKCIAIQFLEAFRNLKASGFSPLRTIHVSYVPDEEIGGVDGAKKFVGSKEFEEMNVGFALDEGQASVNDEFRVFYADRLPWRLIVKAVGSPAHGSRMFDGMAMENLLETMEVIAKFRKCQFDKVKAGEKPASEVVSVNPVYLKAGTPSPTGFVMNMQPSEAEAGFDLRIPPSEDPDLFKKRISEEWVPSSRNLSYKLFEHGPLRDNRGRPLLTATDETNPWWSVFKQAITDAGGKLAKPEILATTTDARFLRQMGIPTLGFSPMSNTPILLHEHNEYLEETVFMRGIKIYEVVISALSSFGE
ncbi:hypothetical protein H6P81_011026 [Aristolochia fimbriata]|uniref:N-acyl-L-amino-acid amidohydrolase n=1 Tax=Aristolochia fimbriata TaxID=158543 RepID=A0AAV7ET83_ARIFI|nr:hypothetical protein H6P81_011026 [Aristolochia fimbriata]